MGWTLWADSYSTSEITDNSKSVAVTFGDDGVFRACRTWIIIYNDPTFTSLSMKIYSNNSSGSPRKLLATSTNVQLKADVHTLPNAPKEIWFEFDYFPVQANEIYHFVLTGSGYTGSSSSHIAWVKGYPDPVLPHDGGAVTFVDVVSSAYAWYPIWSRL